MFWKVFLLLFVLCFLKFVLSHSNCHWKCQKFLVQNVRIMSGMSGTWDFRWQWQPCNEWLLLSASFTAKLELNFCLNTGKRFFLRRSILKPTERAHVLLKNGTRDFKIALRLRDRHVFMWQSLGILSVFNTLTLKQIFWKTKFFFKKLEYHFLVEGTKIENTSFP